MDKIKKLINMLEDQKSDVAGGISSIKEFTKENFLDNKWGGKASKTDFRIMNIMKEWEGMFSFGPGIIEGITLTQGLLEKIVVKPELEILELYKTDEWKRIGELRGPVETVIEQECKKCGELYCSMGLSGFIDGHGLVCNRCGDVYFKSYYEDTENTKCSCGGEFVSGCPKCGEQTSMSRKYFSPYQYFSEHTFSKSKKF